MTARSDRPKWWQVYLTFPLLIGLFILDNRLKLSERGHQALQIGILLLVYGFIHLWLKANETALSDYRQYRGTVMISKPYVYKLDITPKEDRPIFQLPDHEINNTLSDTFEVEIIDAEAFAVDEVLQELEKE